MPPRRTFKAPSRGDAVEKRRSTAFGLRKNKRERALMAKRVRTEAAGAAAALIGTPGAPSQPRAGAGSPTKVVEGLRSRGPRAVEDVKSLRRMLASNPAAIGSALRGGVVEVLLELLNEPDAELQLEACWCLTNIATGTHEETEQVLPAAPMLIAFVAGGNVALQEQAAWTLGNIAGDSEDFRNLLRANGVVPPMVALLASPHTNVVRTAAWALCNLVRGATPNLAELFAAGIVGAVDALMRKELPEDVTVELCWLLSYCIAWEEEYVAILVNVGVLNFVVPLLSSGNEALVAPALRVVGNVVSARDNSMCDAALQAGALEPLYHLLSTEHPSLQKEAAWVVSNVAAGERQHLDALVAGNFVPLCCQLLLTALFDVRVEVAYALATVVMKQRHVALVVEAGGIPAFMALYDSPDVDMLRIALSVTEVFLTSVPNGKDLVEAADGIAQMEKLQLHPNRELYHKANELIDRFYSDYTESDSEEDIGELPAWRVQFPGEGMM